MLFNCKLFNVHFVEVKVYRIKKRGYHLGNLFLDIAC